eukprot:scaffold3282_cov101-Isochrysis_galbana.AAC.5
MAGRTIWVGPGMSGRLKGCWRVAAEDGAKNRIESRRRVAFVSRCASACTVVFCRLSRPLGALPAQQASSPT